MRDEHLFAVIMAGGSGTRFWPASTRARPKQFLAVAGERPMISETVDRLAGLIDPERVLVVAGHRICSRSWPAQRPVRRCSSTAACRIATAACGSARIGAG